MREVVDADPLSMFELIEQCEKTLNQNAEVWIKATPPDESEGSYNGETL